MANFEKIDRMNIEFPQGDIKDINLSGGTYMSNLYINTTSGQIVELRFSSITDFKKTLEMLVTAMLRADWGGPYPGAFITAVEGSWSVEEIQKWKKYYEDDVLPGDSQQPTAQEIRDEPGFLPGAQAEEPPF